jgi:hypothetical protein
MGLVATGIILIGSCFVLSGCALSPKGIVIAFWRSGGDVEYIAGDSIEKNQDLQALATTDESDSGIQESIDCGSTRIDGDKAEVEVKLTTVYPGEGCPTCTKTKSATDWAFTLVRQRGVWYITDIESISDLNKV